MKRIAVIATVYRPGSHAQQIVDRFLLGYPKDGAWYKPDTRVASLYVDQTPAGDQSQARASEFGFQVYPTVAETLRGGGAKLAVDAILVVGEGGEYARNEKGQLVYPRYDFMKQCIDVFEKDGAAVPVYAANHLSHTFDQARAIVDASRRLKFPLLAGSLLPVTWRLPDIDLPLNSEIESALVLGYGDTDVMDFHALEALQSIIERRKGGESGVKAVQMLEGDAVWRASDAGGFSKDLLASAFSRGDSPQGQTVADGRPRDFVLKGELQRLATKPAAYVIDYRDGLKATLLMLTGAVKDFTCAARVKGSGVLSIQFLLTPEPTVTSFSCLVAKIEELFETGRAPYPVERTLLTSGVLESCLISRLEGQKPLPTPHLDVRYRAPQQSQYART